MFTQISPLHRAEFDGPDVTTVEWIDHDQVRASLPTPSARTAYDVLHSLSLPLQIIHAEVDPNPMWLHSCPGISKSRFSGRPVQHIIDAWNSHSERQSSQPSIIGCHVMTNRNSESCVLELTIGDQGVEYNTKHPSLVPLWTATSGLYYRAAFVEIQEPSGTVEGSSDVVGKASCQANEQGSPSCCRLQQSGPKAELCSRVLAVSMEVVRRSCPLLSKNCPFLGIEPSSSIITTSENSKSFHNDTRIS